MRTCVLVIAQQTALRAAVANILLPLGCRVEIASTHSCARQLLAKEKFEAAIVAPASLAAGELKFLHDVQEAVNGFVILTDDANAAKRFVASFPNAAIYPTRPLEPATFSELLSHLAHRKVPSQDTASASEIAHFAGCILDLAGQVFLDAVGAEVPLTRREFALLVAFVRNPGRVLSRAQLRNAIDGRAAEAYDRSIDMLVVRLRRKIERNAAKERFILTVPGAGYKLVPRVHYGKPAETAPPIGVGDVVADARRAERRQLTVLACQIFGFAALADRLDPEDLEQIIDRAYAICAEVIAHFGGRTSRPLGDTVLGYFGHRTAEENSAESGVRAALELLRAVGRIDIAPIGRLRARIGVATGVMVIGESNATGTCEPTAVGGALNLALHLQSAAPADGVLIAATTRDLVGHFFQCCEFGPVVLEAGHEPAPAWRVVSEIAGMPRFDALRRDGMLDLVGREIEIERLSRCWSDIARGSGQVIGLKGEPGIGKSRLVIEFENRLQRGTHAVVRYFGSPQQADAPLSVLLDELQRHAGLSSDDDAPRKLEKLRRSLDAVGLATTETMALIGALFGLPFDTPPEIAQLSPQKRRQQTFDALLARLQSLASGRPLLAVVEDAQWVDPTSLEFFSLLVERAATLRLLLVVVSRLEFTPPWSDYSYVTTLALSRLSRADAAALIHQVAQERRISASVEAQILSRADGVPLFIEELTKSVLESTTGATGRAATQAAVRDRAPPIPTTLQGLLLARIDRLDRGREAAQAGAVIGREFSFALLRAIVRMDEGTLVAALDELVRSGMLFRRGSGPQATFVFKHALIRDAAYGMLLHANRGKLHAEAARCYEEQFPDTVEAQPELLAYHFREAGNSIKSIGYLLAAAERALLRSASTEALSHLAQAGELAATLPKTGQRLRLELRREITTARALLATCGYTAPETRDAYRRARECCEALDDQASLPLIIHGQWLGAWIAADHQSALEEAQRLYLWGQRNNDPVGLTVAHSDLGITLTTLGQLAEGRRHLDQALQINKFVLPGRQPFVSSDVDGRISTLSFLHNCLLLLGFPDQAKAAAAEAAALKPHNLYSRVLAQTRVLRMCVLAREAVAATEIGFEVLRLARDQGYPHFIGISMIHTGWGMAQRGDSAAGIEYCQAGLAQLRTIGSKYWLPFHLALLAECYEQAGDPQRSALVVAQALENVEATGERFWEAEIYRLKGRLLLRAQGDPEAARACFGEALNTARRQQARLFELRAASSLADLWQRQGLPAQAREALAALYASFTEGFDFIDLRDAKALLDRC